MVRQGYHVTAPSILIIAALSALLGWLGYAVAGAAGVWVANWQLRRHRQLIEFATHRQQGRATGQAASGVGSKGRAKNKRNKSKRR